MSSKRVLHWPYVRDSIKGRFKSLLDTEFQKSWPEEVGGRGIASSLNFFVFDYLYDTPWASLWDQAYKCIDVTLYNEEEANAISSFLDFDRSNFDGTMPDAYYVNHPKWPELLSKAKAVLNMMEENNKKYNFAADLKSWDEDYANNIVPSDEECRIINEKTDERLRKFKETNMRL